MIAGAFGMLGKVIANLCSIKPKAAERVSEPHIDRHGVSSRKRTAPRTFESYRSASTCLAALPMNAALTVLRWKTKMPSFVRLR
jgi:hypothetical protein